MRRLTVDRVKLAYRLGGNFFIFIELKFWARVLPGFRFRALTEALAALEKRWAYEAGPGGKGSGGKAPSWPQAADELESRIAWLARATNWTPATVEGLTLRQLRYHFYLENHRARERAGGSSPGPLLGFGDFDAADRLAEQLEEMNRGRPQSQR